MYFGRKEIASNIETPKNPRSVELPFSFKKLEYALEMLKIEENKPYEMKSYSFQRRKTS